MRVTAEELKRWKFACMRVTLCRQRLRASRDRRSSTVAHAQAAGRHCRSIQRDGSLICNKDTLRSALFERRYSSYAGGACERVFCCSSSLCVCAAGRRYPNGWLSRDRITCLLQSWQAVLPHRDALSAPHTPKGLEATRWMLELPVPAVDSLSAVSSS